MRRASPLSMWGAPAAGPTLDWDRAASWLATTIDYWLVSVGPAGRPSSRPVWGVWMDDRLFLSLGSTTHRANLASNPNVTVHGGDTLEVAVVEGTARPETGPDVLGRFCAAYNTKYDWDFDPTNEKVSDGVYTVDPRVVLAWVAAPPEESSEDMEFPLASGKWVF